VNVVYVKLVLDNKIIQMIDLFQNLTGVNVVDCVEDEELYFVVGEGQYGLAVGKNGMKIKNAERVFKKKIKVFEYSADLMTFIKNLVPEAEEITQNEKAINIRIKQSAKAKVIGKSGRNIKILNEILKRHFEIESMKVK
jgi:N utilization substance protein A